MQREMGDGARPWDEPRSQPTPLSTWSMYLGLEGRAERVRGGGGGRTGIPPVGPLPVLVCVRSARACGGAGVELDADPALPQHSAA
jgi:hypothetical protein